MIQAYIIAAVNSSVAAFWKEFTIDQKVTYNTVTASASPCKLMNILMAEKEFVILKALNIAKLNVILPF